MQTHDDGNHNLNSNLRNLFMERLRERADTAVVNKSSQITTGKDGEEALAKWKHKGVFVTHMPDDEQGILRISAGGGANMPVQMNYCTIRGSVGQCIQLLEKVIEALKKSPE